MAGMQARPSSAGTSVDILTIPPGEQATIARHCAAKSSGQTRTDARTFVATRKYDIPMNDLAQ